jgi:hypothetical protein
VEAVARRWIYTDTTPVAGVSGVPFFSVNTPIEQAATPETQCGRFVHTPQERLWSSCSSTSRCA